MSKTEEKPKADEKPGEITMNVPPAKVGSVISDYDETVEDLTAQVPPPKKDEQDFIDLTRGSKRKLVKLWCGLDDEGEPAKKIFEIRLIDDFGLAEQQRLLSYSKAYDKLFTQDEPLNEDEGMKLEFYHEQMFNRVLVAEPADRDKLDAQAAKMVVSTFSQGPWLDSIREQQDRVNVLIQLKELGHVTDEQIEEAMASVQVELEKRNSLTTES